MKTKIVILLSLMAFASAQATDDADLMRRMGFKPTEIKKAQSDQLAATGSPLDDNGKPFTGAALDAFNMFGRSSNAETAKARAACTRARLNAFAALHRRNKLHAAITGALTAFDSLTDLSKMDPSAAAEAEAKAAGAFFLHLRELENLAEAQWREADATNRTAAQTLMRLEGLPWDENLAKIEDLP